MFCELLRGRCGLHYDEGSRFLVDKRVARRVLVASLVVGCATAIQLVAYSASEGLALRVPPQSRVSPTNEIQRMSRGSQLFSDGESFFWRICNEQFLTSYANTLATVARINF